MHLASKYIIHRKKNRSKNTLNNLEAEDERVGRNSEIDSKSTDRYDDKTDNIGSPIK